MRLFGMGGRKNGDAGRIIVRMLGSWIFWMPLIYWIYKKRN